MIRGQRCAHRGTDRLAGLGPAHLEVEVGHPLGGAVDAEDLADHAELEDRQAGPAPAPIPSQLPWQYLIARCHCCHCWRDIVPVKHYCHEYRTDIPDPDCPLRGGRRTQLGRAPFRLASNPVRPVPAGPLRWSAGCSRTTATGSASRTTSTRSAPGSRSSRSGPLQAPPASVARNDSTASR